MIGSSLRRIDWLCETGGNPCFGITEAIFGVGLSGLLGGGALGAIGADVVGGAAAGTALSGIEGKPLGPGALGGAITGGAGGIAGAFGPEIAGATGLPAAGVEAGIGAAGGLLGAEATGGSPITGALTGGIGGVAAGLSAPTAAPAAAPTGSVTPPGGGASAAGIAGGLTGDPNALLGETGGTSFLGATEGGGTIGAPADLAGGFGGGDVLQPQQFLDANQNTAYLGAPGSPTSTGVGVADSVGGAAPGASSGGGISDFFSKHWPMLASAGILGFEALNKNKPLPEESALRANATNAAGQAAALEAPLQTGILPPGAKQAVDAATQAQKGQIKSTYANLGLTGSTMEAQAIGAADRNAAAQTFSIADKLLQQGIDFSKLSAQDLQYLIDEQLKQDQQFTGALTQFAGGLAGARSGG